MLSSISSTPLTTHQNPGATLEACKVITFHPCARLQDFVDPQNEKSFPPLFTHAFFPEEQLSGWLQCKIRIFFTTDTFDVYVDIEGMPSAVSQTPFGTCTSTVATALSNSTSSSAATGVSAATSASNAVIAPSSGAVGSGDNSSSVGSAATSSSCVAAPSAWEDFKSKALDALKQHLCSKVPFSGGFCDSREAFMEVLKPDVKSRFVPSGELYTEVKFVHTTEDQQTNVKSTKASSTTAADRTHTSAVEVVEVNNKLARDAGIETLYLYKSVFSPVATFRSDTDPQTHMLNGPNGPETVANNSTSAATTNQVAGKTSRVCTLASAIDSKATVAVLKLEPDSSAQQGHRRVEWFLHFFIDACSSIEYDHRWRAFFAYIKRTSHVANEKEPPLNVSTYQRGKRQRNDAINSNTVNGGRVLSNSRVTVEQQLSSPDAHRRRSFKDTNSSADENTSAAELSSYYEFIGFTSLYKFFALPKCRLRLSQFFVLPTYQNLGFGVALLNVVHRMTLRANDVMEFAVEDPAPAFKQLRDLVSVQLALDSSIISAEHLYPPKADQENNNVPAVNGIQAADHTALPTNVKAVAKDNTAAPVHVSAPVLVSDPALSGKANAGDADGSSSSDSEDDEDNMWGDFESEVYTRLRKESKESVWQAQRIINLLRFARVMPVPMPNNTIEQPHAQTTTTTTTTTTKTTTASSTDTKNVHTTSTGGSAQAGISALLPVRTVSASSPTKSPHKRNRLFNASSSAAAWCVLAC
eukprot:Lankesteria_metandrocarpae@DN5072_c0_g1_i3.p1